MPTPPRHSLAGCALVVALSLSCSVMVHAQAERAAQDGSLSAVFNPAFKSDSELESALRKRDVIRALINGTSRIEQSWRRYLLWVDPAAGPKMSGRPVYGLYSVSGDIVKRATDRVQMSVDRPPAMPALDDAARRILHSVEPVIAIINKTDTYYDRQDYKDDGMAQGRALHANLMRVVPAFMAMRADLKREFAALQKALLPQELAFVERREGRNYAWHALRVEQAAGPLPALLDGPRPAGNVVEIENAVAEFARATRDFEDYLAKPGAKKPLMVSFTTSSARKLLTLARERRDALKAGRKPNQFWGPEALGEEYESLVERLAERR